MVVQIVRLWLWLAVGLELDALLSLGPHLPGCSNHPGCWIGEAETVSASHVVSQSCPKVTTSPQQLRHLQSDQFVSGYIAVI